MQVVKVGDRVDVKLIEVWIVFFFLFSANAPVFVHTASFRFCSIISFFKEYMYTLYFIIEISAYCHAPGLT